MAWRVRGLVRADDYNSFIGNPTTGNNALSGFSGVTAAQNTLGGLYGAGYGDRGYGQTFPTLTRVSKGQIIDNTQWDNLGDIIDLIDLKQGNLLPDYGDIVDGERIVYFSDLVSNISSLDANRFRTPSRVFTGVRGQNIRSNAWGGGVNSIDVTCDMIFANGNNARYFFNSGSEILVRVRHNSSATAQDSQWNNFLSNQVGDIYVGYNYIRQVAGSPGGLTNATLGYWNLSNTDNLFFTRSGGAGVYSGDLACNMRIQRIGSSNVSGLMDNGNTFRVSISLTDSFTSAFQDSVSGGSTIVQIYEHKNNVPWQPVGASSVTFPNTWD